MEKNIFRSVVIIILLGILVYANSLGGKFIWDDDKLVKNNLRIRSWSGLERIFIEDIGAGAGEEYNFYRPLQTLSYRIDYCLWRLLERGYHFTNILLHILAALTIFWLINLLFNDDLLALLTGSFFIVHPVHTEAVAYISGRADSLALIFTVLSLIFYVKSLRTDKPLTAVLAYSSCILAFLSRESSLIIPIILLLYHLTFKVRFNIKRFFPIAVISLAYVFFRTTLLNLTVPDLSGHPALIERVPSFFIAILSYVRLLLSPFDLHMEYGNRLFNIFDPAAIFGAIVILALISYILKVRRHDTLVFFSLSWFLLTLLPVSGVYPMNAFMAEHWLYLPSIGFFLLLAKGACDIYRKQGSNALFVLVTSIILAVYSFLTIRQNTYWREPVSFFRTTLKYAPDSYKIHTSLGVAYSARGMHEEAIKSYRKALETEPDYAVAYFDLGNAHDALGRRDEASTYYKMAIEIDPEYSRPYNNLGNIYSNAGKIDEAMEMYMKAIGLDPYYHDAYYNLGNEYQRKGENVKAIESYKKAIGINPYIHSTHNNLAVVYFYEKRFDLAIAHCDKAISLGFRPNPDFLKELESYR